MELQSLADFCSSWFWCMLLIWVAWYLITLMVNRVRKLPPGPIGIPILGYAPFIRSNVHESFDELIKKYGPICRITAASLDLIIVGDFEMTKELMNCPALYDRPEKFFQMCPQDGGFAGANGKEWEKERNFMIQALRNIGLGKRSWNDIIQEGTADIVDFIASKKGEPIDCSEPLCLFAHNNMAKLIFGSHPSGKWPSSDIAILDEANRVFKRHFQFSNPTLLWPWLLKYFRMFNISGFRTRCKKMEGFEVIARKEIEKRTKSDDYDHLSDLIASYLQSAVNVNSPQKDINRTVDSLAGHLSIFFSSTDTGTTPTLWLLLLMAAYPEIQAKVQAEIDEVVGRDGLISWNDWKQFPYSMACITEMLRWVTPVPVYIPRSASKTFEYRGYTIPKHSIVLVNNWTLHQDPKYFPKPGDYIPERFLNSEKNKLVKLDGYAPFSFGKRNCPGENITLMILFLVYTGILQKYTIRTPNGDPPNLTKVYAGIMEPIRQKLCFLER